MRHLLTLTDAAALRQALVTLMGEPTIIHVGNPRPLIIELETIGSMDITTRALIESLNGIEQYRLNADEQPEGYTLVEALERGNWAYNEDRYGIVHGVVHWDEEPVIADRPYQYWPNLASDRRPRECAHLQTDQIDLILGHKQRIWIPASQMIID